MLHDFRLLRARRLISSGRRQAFGKAQHKQDVIGAALIGSAIALYWNNWERVAENDVCAAVLAVQALPFLAASSIAALERLRINDFGSRTAVRLSLRSNQPLCSPT